MELKINDAEKIINQVDCYKCKQPGHYSNKCPYTKEEVKEILKEVWYINQCKKCLHNWGCEHRKNWEKYERKSNS